MFKWVIYYLFLFKETYSKLTPRLSIILLSNRHSAYLSARKRKAGSISNTRGKSTHILKLQKSIINYVVKSTGICELIDNSHMLLKASWFNICNAATKQT